MKTTTLVAWSTAALLVGTMTVPAHAQGFTCGFLRATHAMRCVGPLAFTGTPGGQMYNASTNAIQVFCPLESDTTVSFKSDVAVAAHGYANGSQWEGKACYTFASGGGVGGNCGTPREVVGSGTVHMFMNTTAWSDALSFDYPYFLITLGGVVGGSYNVVWGTTLEVPECP